MSERILIVDDDSISSRLVAGRLSAKGFVTFTCDGLADIPQIIKREEIALVFLDIVMPGTSGIEVLKTLRQLYPPIDLPVIMLTSKEGTEDIVTCLSLGANDYLIKPFHTEVATARIQTQLNLKKYYIVSLANKEIEALNAMIVTYNHQINNPLTVALASLKMVLKNGDPLAANRLEKSLVRISDIVNQIDELTRNEIRHDNYSKNTKMIGLKKLAP